MDDDVIRENAEIDADFARLAYMKDFRMRELASLEKAEKATRESEAERAEEHLAEANRMTSLRNALENAMWGVEIGRDDYAPSEHPLCQL